MTPDPAIALRRRFPGLVFWYGTATRSWWAIARTPSGWRLVEATDPGELTRAITLAETWPYPRSNRPSALPQGRPTQFGAAQLT